MKTHIAQIAFVANLSLAIFSVATLATAMEKQAHLELMEIRAKEITRTAREILDIPLVANFNPLDIEDLETIAREEVEDMDYRTR